MGCRKKYWVITNRIVIQPIKMFPVYRGKAQAQCLSGYTINKPVYSHPGLSEKVV